MPTVPVHLPPLEVAAETFLLRSAHPLPGAPLLLATNSLVVRGAEPIVVDTGTRGDRDGWLADLRTLLRPASVRWVVLSSDGHHHLGNLANLLELCPDATVVTCWAAAVRVPGALDVPSHRLRLLADGGRLEAGDRALRWLPVPAYGSPASRAVFDPTTGVLWAADMFATPMPTPPVSRVDELPPAMWSEGMAMLHHHAVAPWLPAVDRRGYAAQVERLRALEPTVVAAAHSPVITGSHVDAAFAHLAALPDAAAPPHPAWAPAAPARRVATAFPVHQRPGIRPDEGDGTRAHT